MTKTQRFEGCIIGGAIGDAFGSAYENIVEKKDDSTFYLFGEPEAIKPIWQITDDTQLTLATIEAMIEDTQLKPETLVRHFLKLYQQKKLRGIGASTLKALRELELGAHWSQVGRRGEYAAGNGAAMRIAPLAFNNDITKQQIRDICFITHHNDEAYVGALCVIIAIKEILNSNWTGTEDLLELIIQQIPDTRVRDRLMGIQNTDDLREIGKLGNSGYVVDSVPLAIAAASKIQEIGIENMYSTLIEIGGDTDTNCSIAGQIAGTLVGKQAIPANLIDKFSALKEHNQIEKAIHEFKRVHKLIFE